jgi:hypothetical protein
MNQFMFGSFLSTLPFFALAISICALVWSIASWRKSNRPFVLISVTANGMGGNEATPLFLRVENFGNRPALKIKIGATPDVYEKCLNPDKRARFQEVVNSTLTDAHIIPLLGIREFRLTSFGHLEDSAESTWIANSEFPISVHYEDFDGRRFSEEVPIIVADGDGFGGGMWVVPKKLK